MTILKRVLVTLLSIAILGGLVEVGLRALVPSLIEGGARVALRVPQNAEVTVETHGSMVLNALRWRISDVVVEADQVPLSEEITAAARLEIGAMPLLPAFGQLHDGHAVFAVPPEHLDAIVQLTSHGLADHGEMQDGTLVVSGTLTDADFDLPYSPSFEIPFTSGLDLAAEAGEILVTPTSLAIQDQSAVGVFLAEAMAETRAVCFRDRLPAGVVLSGIEVREAGAVDLYATLSEGLLSSPRERMRGTCS